MSKKWKDQNTSQAIETINSPVSWNSLGSEGIDPNRSLSTPSLLFSLCFSYYSYVPASSSSSSSSHITTFTATANVCILEEAVGPRWAVPTQLLCLLCSLRLLWNRDISIGMFSVWKEKLCFVMTLSPDQFFP